MGPSPRREGERRRQSSQELILLVISISVQILVLIAGILVNNSDCKDLITYYYRYFTKLRCLPEMLEAVGPAVEITTGTSGEPRCCDVTTRSAGSRSNFTDPLSFLILLSSLCLEAVFKDNRITCLDCSTVTRASSVSDLPDNPYAAHGDEDKEVFYSDQEEDSGDEDKLEAFK